MTKIVASFFVYFLLQIYALVTLMFLLGENTGATVLLFVLFGGAVTGASIVSCCIRDINTQCYELIAIIAILSVLPIGVGFLGNVLPIAVYFIVTVIYAIVFALLGIIPALIGGLVYLITGLFVYDNEIRAVIAFISVFVFGILFSLWIENKFWHGRFSGGIS